MKKTILILSSDPHGINYEIIKKKKNFFFFLIKKIIKTNIFS